MKFSLANLFCLGISILMILTVLRGDNVFSKKLTRMKNCRNTVEDACVILCNNLESKNEDIGEVEGQEFETYELTLENCYAANATFDDGKNLKIVSLKIIDSSIDLNQLNLKIFKNLRRLTLKNTTTISLESKTYRQLPKLERLVIKPDNRIKWVEEGFLQNLTLESLQIQGLILNQSERGRFFKNLTGGRDIPRIQKLDWSHNNFGNFSADLLIHFRNLSRLILTNSSISVFDEGTFNHGTIKYIIIDQNNIQNLPEEIFRPLIEKASFVSIAGNNLTCDCSIKWLQNLLKRRESAKSFQITCAHPEGVEFLEADLCRGKPENITESSMFDCGSKQYLEGPTDCDLVPNEVRFSPIPDIQQKFSIKNENPELIEITLSSTIDDKKIFLLYGNYGNITSPQFKCLKMQQKFNIFVTPNTNYLICLAMISKYAKIDIFNCFPFKTRPPYEDEPLLTRKSIPLSILFILVLVVFALAFGALILYLSVCRNPSLIRGSKRVIEVKRHDKAQVLIMPRGYERVSQTDTSSLLVTNPRLPQGPSRSLSCDTISTVSYVSAHQPTQLEILSYRLNRFRELFQRNNNLPAPIPMRISTSISQRLPPDVDLLFEYEWYTITTTTTTTTKE